MIIAHAKKPVRGATAVVEEKKVVSIPEPLPAIFEWGCGAPTTLYQLFGYYFWPNDGIKNACSDEMGPGSCFVRGGRTSAWTYVVEVRPRPCNHNLNILADVLDCAQQVLHKTCDARVWKIVTRRSFTVLACGCPHAVCTGQGYRKRTNAAIA